MVSILKFMFGFKQHTCATRVNWNSGLLTTTT